MGLMGAVRFLTVQAVLASAAGLVAPALLPSSVAAFELNDCRLVLQSFDEEGDPLDTAVGGSQGGEGGTQDDPFTVARMGTVRYEGDTGEQVITDFRWSIDVFLIPTPLRGSDPNEDEETAVEGEIDIGRTVPFGASGLIYISGELAGEGGACRGGLWVRLGTETDEVPATTIPFWIALLIILAGVLVLWAARPGLVVPASRAEVR